MVKISIVLTTCRESYGAMIGVEDWELFTPTIESLKKQSMMDFELVIVDVLHHERPDRFKNVELPFKVKHIPFTCKESRWLKRGMYNNVQQRNKGIIYSDGELVVFAADCCEFSPEAMERYWYWYKKGLMPQAVFRYNKGGEPLRDKHGELVKDHRWRDPLDKSPTGKATYTWTNWFREYGAAPMDALLEINGFDELFDGTKSLEDVEIGMRLAAIGYTKYVLDQRLYVIENCHYAIPKRIFTGDHNMRGKEPVAFYVPNIKKYTRAFKDNYSIMMYNQRHNRWKANTDVLTDEAIAEIKNFSLEQFAKGVLQGDPILWEKSPHFHYWKSHQPIFSLQKLWEERINRGE